MFYTPYPHTENIKQWQISKVYRIFRYDAFDDIFFEYIYLKEDDSSTMGFLREIQKNDSSLMKVADIESEDSKWNNKSFDEKLYHLCRVYAATKAYAKQLKKKYKLN